MFLLKQLDRRILGGLVVIVVDAEPNNENLFGEKL
jgi:hypothetical protein